MIRVFVDFDGTITSHDVGDAMFEIFGGTDRCRDIVRRYREGELSAVECFRQECAACGLVEQKALDRFLDSQPVDESFIDFVEFCRRRSVAWYVVSDGMDYYIHRILSRMGIAEATVFANSLSLVPANDPGSIRLEPSFPFQDESCDRCACCKRNHMLTLSADDDVILYVGEGYSDRCPARYADVVFAKDDLARYCRREGIAYYPYRSFGDVQEQMDRLCASHRVRKRRRAELARREVYAGG